MNDNSFFVDVIRILPDATDCYIQAPSLDDEIILNLMSSTSQGYYKLIKLIDDNKLALIQRVKDFQVEEFFHSVEIKLKDKLLFEGYDGVEFGIISKTVNLPKWFIDTYVTAKICNISNDW